MNRQLIFTALAGIVGGIGTGLSFGYVIAKRHLEHHYDEQLRVEVENAKEYYKKVYKRDQFENPTSAADALMKNAVEVLKVYQGESPVKPEQISGDAEVVTKNIFADGPPSPQEIDENEPHIIPEEEFLENPNEYEQYNMTYYTGDGVLTDDRDQPVEPHNVDSTVGSDNLEEFKRLDEDDHVIYVRNNKLKCEFEIARHEGKYAVEVLGLRE